MVLLHVPLLPGRSLQKVETPGDEWQITTITSRGTTRGPLEGLVPSVGFLYVIVLCFVFEVMLLTENTSVSLGESRKSSCFISIHIFDKMADLSLSPCETF